MTTPYGNAFALGTIQGLTDFLPVSRSGHAALAEFLFHIEVPPAAHAMLAAGTLAAACFVLRRPLGDAIRDAFGTAGGSPLGDAAGDALFVVTGAGPSIAFAVLVHDTAVRWSASPSAVAFGFLVTGALLAASGASRPSVRDRPSFPQTLILGAAQGAAVLPGLSRTAFTVGLSLLFGVRPVRAFELSVMLGIPMDLFLTLGAARRGFDLADVPVALVAAGGAFAAATVAIVLLRRAVVRGSFSLFAFWVVPLAFATMALAWAWPA